MVWYLSMDIYFSFHGQDIALNFPTIPICIVFIFTVMIPIAATYFTTGDLYLSDRKTRSLPIGISIVSYIACYYFLTKFFHENYSFSLSFLLIIFIIGLALVWLINHKYKISLHGTGIGAIYPILFVLIYSLAHSHLWIPFTINILFLLLSFLVLVQRISSGAHKVSEVIKVLPNF